MQHARTPWTKKASSLPSDRIPPPARPPAQARQKAGPKQQDPPKSAAVRQLELRREELARAQGRQRDPQGGCFCQARLHALSTFTPICRNCGLVLCELQKPHFACPHCAAPLLSHPAREALIGTLEAQIADTLAREEAARIRATEEARAAAGAFPTLSAAAAGSPPDALAPHPVNRAHKVLSVNSKTKRVTVSSITTPPASRPPSRDARREMQEEPTRVPPPPPEVPFAGTGPRPRRPWENLLGSGAVYVPPPNAVAEGSSTGKRGKGQGKASKNEKERV